MQPVQVPKPDPELLEIEAKIAAVSCELAGLRKKVDVHEVRLARLERQRDKLKK